jgi:hypothetical protein
MKKFILSLFLMFVGFICFGQNATYYQVKSGQLKNGNYISYECKDGKKYMVGDKVKFGLPSGANGNFVSIQKLDIAGQVYVVRSEAVNTEVEIKKIRVTGSKKRGQKVSFQTKGLSGVDNYFFYIEDALTLGEIDSGVMTSDEALAELQKAKAKLDLGLITQEEFNEIKEDLSRYIK